MDGAIVLTQRRGTVRWQARFKIDGRWKRVTTKAKTLAEAKVAAKESYLDATYRVNLGVPAQSKRFKDVAKMAVNRMQKALDGGGA